MDEYDTTFAIILMAGRLFSFLSTPDNIIVRMMLMLGSTVLIAVGIFFYLPADIIPLAGEGAILGVINRKFGEQRDMLLKGKIQV